MQIRIRPKGSGPSKIRRRHGLHSPWDVYQIIAIACFVYFVIITILFVLPLAPLSSLVKFTIFAAVAASIIILQVTTSIRDPVDSGLPTEAEGPFCNVCEKGVHPGTKHCWSCNKCVEGFDHHCKWLNTCIGQVNYKTFFVLLWATLLFTGIVAAGTLYAFVVLARESTKSSERISRYMHIDIFVPVIMAAVLLASLLSTAAHLLILQLLLFHLYLWKRGITTYQYVLERRRMQAVLSGKLPANSPKLPPPGRLKSKVYQRDQIGEQRDFKMKKINSEKRDISPVPQARSSSAQSPNK